MQGDGFSNFKGHIGRDGAMTCQYGSVMSFSGRYLRGASPGHFTAKTKVTASKIPELVGGQESEVAAQLMDGDILHVRVPIRVGPSKGYVISEYFTRPPKENPELAEELAEARAEEATARAAAASFEVKEGGAKRPMMLDEWRKVEGPLARVGVTAPRVVEFGEGRRCSFWFVSADRLRTFAGKTPPSLQGLRQEHPTWLEQRTVSFAQGCEGEYVGKVLVVSHRWEDSSAPDAGGVQFAAIKQQLLADTSIQWVWYDFWSMPQGERADWEDVEFRVMLPNINLLYLFCSVLILLDGSYMSRFWTQLEAFLSLRKVTMAGLDSAPVAERRCVVRCIHNADPEFDAPKLFKMWANKTAAEAHAILERPDVTVTNQSDKAVQLPKLKSLDVFARRVFKEEKGAAA